MAPYSRLFGLVSSTMSKLRIGLKRVEDSWCWEIAHEAVSRRPSISFTRSVACTEGYTYAAQVRALPLVQAPVSVAAYQNPNRLDSQLSYRGTHVARVAPRVPARRRADDTRAAQLEGQGQG
jgi:hypothetical protein